MTEALSGNRMAGSPLSPLFAKRKKAPDPKRFGAATDPLVEKIEAGMIAARDQARALDEDMRRQKGDFGRKRLEQMDRLLNTYLMLARMMAARGDARGAAHIAAQAKKMLAHAPEAVANARDALDLSTAGADPGQRARAFSELDGMVRSLAAKVRAVAGQVERAADLGDSDENRKTLREMADELREMADRLEDLVLRRDPGNGPEQVAERLLNAAEERAAELVAVRNPGGAAMPAHIPAAEPELVATEA